MDLARTGQGETGKWEVIADESSAWDLVIAQTSRDPTDYRFPLAIYRPLSITNARMSVGFKPVAGRVDQAGALPCALPTPTIITSRGPMRSKTTSAFIGGQGEAAATRWDKSKVTSREWHTLTLAAEGDRFTVGFDGKELFTAKDEIFADSGKIALWTKADSDTYFDHLRIVQLP